MSRVRGALAPLLCLLCTAAAHADGLPDGRAYEQVSPVDKNGADIASTFGTPFTGVHVAADGNSVAYFAATPFTSSPNGLVITLYRSARGASGWSTTPISQPLPVPGNGLDIEYVSAFSPDLSQAIIGSTFPYDQGDTDGLTAASFDEYLFGGGTPAWLSHGTIGGDLQTMAIFAGASNDLSTMYFETPEKLLPGLPDLTSGQYVYERKGADLTLVNVDSGGTMLDSDGATVGNGHPSGFEPTFDSGWARNAVSDDGTKVFLEAPNPASADPSTGHGTKLYLRDTAAGTTTLLSDGNGMHNASFAGASSDGSKVFFLTDEALTGDDTDTDQDVYEYDTTTGTLTRASHGSGTEDANVAGVAWVSDNGAHLYYVAMNSLGAGGAPGEPNLYRYDTATDTTTFIATLSGDDSAVWSGDEQGHNAFATPDGKTLAFVSDANLTSYDAQGHREVYVYHTFPGSLACASCRTNGSPPTGDADIGFRSDPGFSHGWVTPVSDDGRVFFDTTDTLVGDDVNGNVGGTGSQDVYEYADGVPSLISDGRSNTGAWLAGVGASGKDVYFFTRSALTPSDVDGGELDVYDARVGGGFPPPAGAPTPCEGDACHGAPVQAPFLPVPATTSAQGDNSVIPAASFSVTAISRSAAKTAARSGRLLLTVRSTAPGTITAGAFGRVSGTTRRVAKATHTFDDPGTAHMTLSLSKSARTQLRRHGRFALRIDVTNSDGLRKTAHVTLRRNSK
jgi:hypothetical protein